ncbi:MAG: T9SS type A sorting domain-containing protein [Bacteroidota bacterium]
MLLRRLAIAIVLVICFGAVFFISFQKTEQPEASIQEEAPIIDKIPLQDRPDLAAAYDFEMTKDPALGYVPTKRKLEAYEIAKKQLASIKRARGIDNVQWDERGPDNIGGRTRAIMFDPNDPKGVKVWAAGVGGGLWFNGDITDANSMWFNVDDFMANLAVNSLTYDPTDTQVFYMGTGEGYFNSDAIRGAGIWKSEDGGTTWTQLPSTDNSNFHYVQKIEITATGTIMAATRSGLFRSINDGASWTSIISGRFADIEIASDGTIYASRGIFSAGSLFKSTTDGVSFDDITPQTGGERIEIAIAPSDPNIIYTVASSGNDVAWMRKSEDAGDTWFDITVPRYTEQNCSENVNRDFTRSQAWYDLILAVNPANPDSVIVGGIDLLVSGNGGSDWELVSYWTGACDVFVHADQHAIEFNPRDPLAAIVGNDGGVFYSPNLGASDNPTFQARNNGYNVTQFYACATADEIAGNYFLAGAQDNGTQRFQQAGINSTTFASGGDGAFCFVDQDNPNVQITSFIRNSYFRSLNGGATFSRFINETASGIGRFINPADYDNESDILYAARQADEYARYSNISGSTVNNEVVSFNTGGRQITHIHVSPYTAGRIFAANDQGQIYMIDGADGNSPTSTDIDNGSLPIAYVSCIEIGASDDQLLAVFSNFGVTSVWETLDGGQTWSNKEGNLPDIPVRWVLYNPNDRTQVMLATELGVWTTDDITAASPEWEPSNTGLANVRCDMLQIRAADNQVVVATHGRGLFTTNVFTQDIIPAFSADRIISYVGSAIQFENNSFGIADNLLWSFGDDVTSTDEDPVHIYDAPGVFTVTLSLNDGEFTETKESFITILPERPVNYVGADGGDFEVNQQDFANENISGTPFQLGNSEVAGKAGTASGDNAWVTGLVTSSYTDNSESYLYTPNFDFGCDGEYTFSFQGQYNFEEGWDGFIVQYSLDSGLTWTKLNNFLDVDNWYDIESDPQSIFGANVPIFSGSTNELYEAKSTDVSFLSGNPRVAFRFQFLSDGGVTAPGLAIDDFSVSIANSNIPAFSVEVDQTEICEGESVNISLLSSTSGIQYSFINQNGEQVASDTVGNDGDIIFPLEGLTDTTTLIVRASDPSSNCVQVVNSEVLISVKPLPGTEITNNVGEPELVAPDGDSFQWFLNGNAISGATDRIFIPISFGTYTVEVISNNCVSVSEAFQPVIVGLEDELGTEKLCIYPNPGVGRFSLETGKLDWSGHQLMVFNSQGKQVYTNTIRGSITQIDITNQPAGVYFVEITDGEDRIVRKLNKVN